ncbi:MAG: hypothetical protein EDM74_06605 [Armatimonadetes bacterium]|nr:MAG: hypothetical protein EDM74_06605 [Armatimonadota bacterium]
MSLPVNQLSIAQVGLAALADDVPERARELPEIRFHWAREKPTLRYNLSVVLMPLLLCLSLQGEIATAGSLRETMREGKVEVRLALAPLNSQPHLYALGPVTGLRGEITVVDGVIHVGTVVGGRPLVKVEREAQAVFLAYTYVASWSEVASGDGGGLAEIASALSRTKRERTPFLVTGRVKRADYHIMDYRPDGGPWSMDKHDQAKAKFALQEQDVTLFGFYTEREEDAGLFVHHGERIHAHVVAQGATGHLDAITLEPGWKLLLPSGTASPRGGLATRTPISVLSL